jgi:hypothetical protein
MKQLKIISDNYKGLNGLISVNFNEPIIVLPNSTIAMDKFSMQVSDGVTDNIILPFQSVGINTNTKTTPRNTTRSANIPSGTYETIPILLEQLNESFNSILFTDLTNPVVPTSDSGLFLLNRLDTTNGKVVTGFGSSAIDYTPANWSLNNMTATGVNPNSEITNTDVGEFSLKTTIPIVKGGIDIEFNLSYVPNDNEYEFEYGLYDISGDFKFGIKKAGVLFYIYNNTNAIQISAEPFVNHVDYTHQFYVDGGQLRYQILNSLDEVVYKTPTGAFNGFSFNNTYDFQVNGIADTDLGSFFAIRNLGICYQSNIVSDTFGVHWDYPSFTTPDYLKTFPLDAVPPTRIVQLNFTNAPVLQFGLGFQSTIFSIGGNGSTSGSVIAELIPSFEDYYDLALQIPSLQLESYCAITGGFSTANSSAIVGGRVNNICYFIPQPESNTNQTIYSYENKELKFVQLSNKLTINMNSMQFRVVYADTNLPVQCDKLSFNLYIDERPSL